MLLLVSILFKIKKPLLHNKNMKHIKNLEKLYLTNNKVNMLNLEINKFKVINNKIKIKNNPLII